MLQSLDTVWKNCLQNIQQKVNQQSFRTWFEPIKPVRLESDVLTIQVPSQFFYEWLEEHYVSLLRQTIHEHIGPTAHLEYQIVVDKIGDSTEEGVTTTTNKSSSTSSIKHKGKANIKPPIKNPFIIPGIKELNIESHLNPYYTFENFVEGPSNQLARSAAIAVANNPGGTAFNPLVLYGGVGLGKTHLAQAIGNQVKTHLKEKTILYVSSEKFTNQFIDAVKAGSIHNFMNFYQLIDILIVDDIQFFTSKGRTQEIFFHTFNQLHQSGKQIILTSDRAPKDLEGMEERLISRFKWGLNADIRMPDFETRVAILEKKLNRDGIEIARDIVEYIAFHINTNVREMEGALVSLLAQSSLSQKDVDLELARTIVHRFVVSLSKEISIEYIQKIVSAHFQIPIEMLKGKTRKRAVVQARQISMYLAKKCTENSLKVIGQHFGGRDHSTVIHACQTILNLIETDRGIQRNVRELQKQLKLTS